MKGNRETFKHEKYTKPVVVQTNKLQGCLYFFFDECKVVSIVLHKHNLVSETMLRSRIFKWHLRDRLTSMMQQVGSNLSSK